MRSPAAPTLPAFLIACALAWASAAAQSQPATTQALTEEEQEAAEIEREKNRCAAEFAALPKAQVKSLGDVVTFAIEKEDVVLRTSIPPTDNSAVVVPGAEGFMTVRTARVPGEGDDSPYVPDTFILIRNEFPQPFPGTAITNISSIGQRVQISQTSEVGGEYRNVDFIQNNAFLAEGDERVRFYAQSRRNDVPVDDLELAARDIIELRRKYPAETMRYLEPIFRSFGQAGVLFQVNSRAAWQVLGSAFDPPADLVAQVESLLKRLDADDAPDRAAALAELEKLGQPAALALMKRGRGGLSEEQLTRVETFLATYKPLPDDEAELMRDDPEFLLLALSSDDAALGKLALARLSEMANEPITFDLTSAGSARADAIAQLRARLLPATTQPATTQAISR